MHSKDYNTNALNEEDLIIYHQNRLDYFIAIQKPIYSDIFFYNCNMQQ